MTLIELLAFACALLCGVFAGMYAFSIGGFLFGVVGFLIGTGTFILIMEGIGRLSSATHQRPEKKETRCRDCGNSDYDWVESDADQDPIAKCKCGKRFVLKKGKWIKLASGTNGHIHERTGTSTNP